MRSVHTVLVVALLTACGGTKEAATPAPPAAPPGPTLATFAGTWDASNMIAGQTKPVMGTMTGTMSDTGWTMALEGRPKIALTVSISGDSLVAQSAEYESVLRKGVTVSTRTAAVLKDGKLEGSVTATYKTAKGAEVVLGTMTATKAAPK